MRRLSHGLLLLLALAPGVAAAQGDNPAAGGGRGTAEVEDQANPLATSTAVVDPRIKKWADRFKGSLLVFDHSVSPETIFPGVQLSALPSYEWWFSLRPRYNFTPHLSLRVRLDLRLEWFNAAETTYYREAQFGDIWTDVVYTGIPKFGGIGTSVGLRALIPTSKPSIAQGNILSVGASAGLSRPFETRAGEFEISLGGYIGHTFTKSTTAGLTGGLAYQCQTSDFEHEQCEQVSGREAPYLNLTASLSLRYQPIKRLSIGVAYILIDAWRNPVGTGQLQDQAGGSTTVAAGSATDTRLSTSGWFLANVDLDVLKWLQLSLGYYTYRPVFDDNIHNGQDAGGSGIGDPFWKPGGASRIFFSFNFALDAIYESVATRTARSRATAAAAAPLGVPTSALGSLPARF